MNKNAVLLCRASDLKQIIEGDSLENQVKLGEYYINKQEDTLLRTFKLVESGRKAEREYFEEVIKFCENPKNKVDYILFKDISRFTRSGGQAYAVFKSRLNKNGVDIRDTEGIIQGQMDTMEHLGFTYNWSKYSPSEANELLAAENAKSDVRQILTKMIGAEINYVNKGYAVRPAPLGYKSIKVHTDNGKRTIYVPDEKEALWFKTMFEMRSKNIYTDSEIVEKVNGMGFETREIVKRDKQTKRIIGYSGKCKLTVKMLQKYITKTVYAGLFYEKWTHSQPIKCEFDGLITIEIFNLANRGKVYIEKSDSNYKLILNRKSIQRLKNNPFYPYKRQVLCNICKNPLLGSASTNKVKKSLGYYHCSRGHNYLSIPRGDLHKTVENVIKQIKFTKEFTDLFKQVFMDVWEQKRNENIDQSIHKGDQVKEIQVQQKTILEKIKVTGSPIVQRALESEYDELQGQLALLQGERNDVEDEHYKIDETINFACYLMEHPFELFADITNPLNQATYFSIFFKSKPTYNDLVNGTPELSWIFELSKNQEVSKSYLVTPAGFEPAVFALRRRRPKPLDDGAKRG